MNHCRIIGIGLSDTAPITEPVTLVQAKAWMKITFTDDDTVITDLIKSARESIEQFCTISLVAKTVNVIAELKRPNNRELAELPLPYGPVVPGTSFAGITVSLNKTGNSDDYEALTIDQDYTVKGIDHYIIETGIDGRYKVSYSTNPGTIPQRLKEAVLSEIVYRYENRGDSDTVDSICQTARLKAKPYKRMIWL